ncbi:MAG: phosphotransferase [bacterium]|nr:phosphotransferase [bacterium]
MVMYQKTKSALSSILPNKIDKYNFINKISKVSDSNFYELGIYKDDLGKQAIVKLFRGSYGIHRQWLKNEATVYRILHELYAKKGDEIKKVFPHIRIPNLLKVETKKEYYIVMIELVDGANTLAALDGQKMAELSEEVAKYFQFISTLLSDVQKQLLVERNAGFILLMTIFLSTIAVLRHPSAFFSIVKAVYFIFFNGGLLYGEQSFVHRDIHPANILYDGRMVYPIDFQTSVLAHPMFEISHLAITAWKFPDYFWALQESKTFKKIFMNKKILNAYKALSLYCGIHRLAIRSEIGTTISFMSHIDGLRVDN